MRPHLQPRLTRVVSFGFLGGCVLFCSSCCRLVLSAIIRVPCRVTEAVSIIKIIGVVQIDVSVIRGIYTLGHAQTGPDCDGSVKGALPPPRDNTWV